MKKFSFLHAFILCICTLILCILLTIAPLTRLASTTLLSSVPIFMLLTIVGTKLPSNLYLTANIHASHINTDTVEFLSIMLLAYLVYALSVWLVQKYIGTTCTSGSKRLQEHTIHKLLQLIWLGAVLIGIIYVLAPVQLSRDITAYAGYGRIIVIYHTNPYYTVPATFPHDLILQANDWPSVVSAYGPVWLVICAISTFVAGNSLLHYILFYRVLGLAAHLVNIALVTTILRKMGHSQRTVVIGTLLYACNPLVLLESCMSGHNDIEMVTCILLGVFLCLRAERDNFKHIYDYLPPMLAFTCAALIKFTAVPILVLYIVLLARRVFGNASSSKQQQGIWARWVSVVRIIAGVAFIGILVSGILYIPLWFGHPPQAIAASLGSPPASRLAFGSILLALQKVAAQHQLEPRFLFLSLHSTWNIINALVVIGMCAMGAIWLWRIPTTQTVVQATLATLGALLIVTPWFFPWYLVWLVGLAAISIPVYQGYLARALVVSTFVFSVSALFIYLFRGYPPIGDWIGFTSLTTIGPPLAIFLFLLIPHRKMVSIHANVPQTVEMTNQPVP